MEKNVFSLFICARKFNRKKENCKETNYTPQLTGKQDKVLGLQKTQHLQSGNSFHRRETAASQPDNGNNKKVLQLKKLQSTDGAGP